MKRPTIRLQERESFRSYRGESSNANNADAGSTANPNANNESQTSVHLVGQDPEPAETGGIPGDIDLSQLEGLTLYEKKCVLINREIDNQGMGRYQWYIWCLCGFGYMLDLMWAQAFGLVVSPMQQELGFGNDQSGNLSTSFNAGLTAGAFIWGVMSDIVGKSIIHC